MLEKQNLHPLVGVRAQINDAYRLSEIDSVSMLMKEAALDDEQREQMTQRATSLVQAVREGRKKTTGIDSFLAEYSLSTEEGIALMCLAEALLRVPDDFNVDLLIKDKLSHADWGSHRAQSPSFFVNATTWALMITGKVLSPEKAESVLTKSLLSFLHRSTEGVLRASVDKAMRIMSKQFVMGRTIEEALKRAKKKEAVGYRYSYDMLGEAALTSEDAARYFKDYAHAIEAIGTHAKDIPRLYDKPGISIKLSALHPRYQETQAERVIAELVPVLLSLAQSAKHYDIGLTVDAEESERLDISLDVIERVAKDKSLDGWDGFGLAVQSYQKRAFYVLDWVAELARSTQKRMMVRLIKGAYWDTEIKKTQMQGLADYPVFTRKVFTDVSFQACAIKLLTMTDAIYPQFATHNACSVAMILSIVGDYRDFEFQCLHGMGNELYEQIVPVTAMGIPCRIYAPVGTHEDLLPYLVRRLLENGANSSFVNRVVDDAESIEKLVEDPLIKAKTYLDKMNANIPLPHAIFMPQRINSKGIDWSCRATREKLQRDLLALGPVHWKAEPMLGNKVSTSQEHHEIFSPQAKDNKVGEVIYATPDDVEWALNQAAEAFPLWTDTPVAERAAWLRRFSDLIEENTSTFLAMACLEAGKTWQDAIGELREAVDFCRYYASLAEEQLSIPLELKGYTGEINTLSLHPRGVILCISPWNFPLAIYVGQVVAALVTGNCVIAKPAEQTPLIAHFAATLLFKAGIPEGVLQVLPGRGEVIGAQLVADHRIKGVIFTGSTQTAHAIHQSLSARRGEIIPLIAETGGQNAMIVDSSALLEQVAVDVLYSAFGSAGQRCSALRVLYIQEEVYPRLIELLQGAMKELSIGDPRWLTTDVGPVIDEEALDGLMAHVALMKATHDIIYTCSLPKTCDQGYFMPPTVIAIDSLDALKKEVFGPVLHVIKFKREALDEVIKDINATGYGLTLGIHSRIHETVDYIRKRLHVGNCYVNRNMVGAVVGLQPFGGSRASGTNDKAGGEFNLIRWISPRTIKETFQ
ncbi:MAG: bifunctional proline dehydrogenase/L-glutamate gamma-semialdehyde dehydrogenase PutA, partial [Legionellaceae bacterium]